MSRRRLLEACRPVGQNGYDHGAIARALTAAQRETLATLAASAPPAWSVAPATLQSLVEAGLAVVTPQGVRLSFLGGEVVEHGLASLFDDEEATQP